MVIKERNFHYGEIAEGTVTNRKLIDLKEYDLKPNGKELYRSLFRFDKNASDYFEKFNSLKGYSGKVWTESLPIDFDSEDLNKSKEEIIKFSLILNQVYDVDLKYLDFSFSGSKGFHLILDGRLFNPDGFNPNGELPNVLKSIIEDLADGFECIDKAIYNRLRLFRLKNSMNIKSGLYKIPLRWDELSSMSIEKIKDLAKNQRHIETFPKSEITTNENLNEIYLKYSSQTNKTIKTDIKSNLFDGVSEGQRHNKAIEIISNLRYRGLNNNYCTEILKLWNNSLSEPLPENEIKSIINSTKDWQKQDEIEIINLNQGLSLYADFVKSLKTERIILGFPKTDYCLRSLIPGEVLQIQGATGYGKSMLALNIAKNYAESTNKPLLYFSLEMPFISLIERICQMKLRKSGLELEQDFEESEKATLYYANQMDTLRNLYFVEKTNLDLRTIERYIDYYRENIGELKFIVVDYLGLLKHDGKSLYERMSELGRNLKNLAKSKNVFVLSLVQINRNGQARDSGSIEEAADYLLSIEKEPEDEFLENNNDLILSILKNRKGALGKTKIQLDISNLTFKEI